MIKLPGEALKEMDVREAIALTPLPTGSSGQERIGREVSLPPGSWLSWGGQFENLVAARERLTLVVLACFFLIFLLLYSAFNSAKYALLVFTGVPLALTGGIVLLWLRDMPFSISAAVGFIALSRVVVLNGLALGVDLRGWSSRSDDHWGTSCRASKRWRSCDTNVMVSPISSRSAHMPAAGSTVGGCLSPRTRDRGGGSGWRTMTSTSPGGTEGD